MEIRNGLINALATLAIASVLCTSPAVAQADCVGAGRISNQIAKPMSEAQKAMKAKEWDKVLAHTAKAQVIARTPFDHYWIDEFRGYALHNLGQTAEAARALEGSLNNPCMPENQKLERYKSLVGLYAGLSDHAKVIEYANLALRDARDSDMQIALAMAYYLSGNNKDAARVLNDAVNTIEAGGKKPKEHQLLLLWSACEKARDNTCSREVLEKLVVQYPKSEYWQSFAVALKKDNLNDQQILDSMQRAAGKDSLTVAALDSWLNRYGAAWEARDAAAAGALFAADASYHEMPFDAPKRGRAAIEEYWRNVTADQRDIQFESKVIAVNANTGVAHWKATFRVASTGATLALDGVFVLEFDASGACKSLREWWHLKTE